jgi:WD40 repeat protein
MAKLDRPPVFNRRWRITLEDHIQSLEWSKDGSALAVATISGPISVLDPTSGAIKQKYAGHGFGTLVLGWHPDQRQLVSGGQDGKVKLWSLDSPEAKASLPMGSAWVEVLKWSPNGKFLAVSAGKKLAIIDPEMNQLTAYPDQPKTIADLVWFGNSRQFATGGFGGVRFWSPTGTEMCEEFEWRGAILKLALSPDEKLLAAGAQESTVHFWYVKDGKDLEMSGYPLKVRELSWDSSSKMLATGGGELITIWNCGGKGPAGSQPIQLGLHTEPLASLTFQKRGPLLASGCITGKVVLWCPSLSEKHLAFSTLPDDEGVANLQWSPSDGLLAVGGDRGTVEVYSV